MNARFGDRKTVKSESSDGDKVTMNGTTSTATTTAIVPITTTTVADHSSTTQVTLSTTTTSPTTSPTALNPNEISPLEWYAGFQPMLLTLPDDQFVKQTHWVSIYDHNRQVMF